MRWRIRAWMGVVSWLRSGAEAFPRRLVRFCATGWAGISRERFPWWCWAAWGRAVADPCADRRRLVDALGAGALPCRLVRFRVTGWTGIARERLPRWLPAALGRAGTGFGLSPVVSELRARVRLEAAHGCWCAGASTRAIQGHRVDLDRTRAVRGGSQRRWVERGPSWASARPVTTAFAAGVVSWPCAGAGASTRAIRCHQVNRDRTGTVAAWLRAALGGAGTELRLGRAVTAFGPRPEVRRAVLCMSELVSQPLRCCRVARGASTRAIRCHRVDLDRTEAVAAALTGGRRRAASTTPPGACLRTAVPGPAARCRRR